jgi:hypothetical protein
VLQRLAQQLTWQQLLQWHVHARTLLHLFARNFLLQQLIKFEHLGKMR